MEVGDDGDLYSILGNLTINLNEYVGLMDYKLRVPVECDSEIIEAVGQPHFEISIRYLADDDHEQPYSSDRLVQVLVQTGDRRHKPEQWS